MVNEVGPDGVVIRLVDIAQIVKKKRKPRVVKTGDSGAASTKKKRPFFSVEWASYLTGVWCRGPNR